MTRLFIAATLLASWLGMQAVHEAGHVLAAILTGGRVSRVVLHPLTISRTELTENPHPVIVGWAGPLFGVIAPLAMWGLGQFWKLRGAFVLRFFAGFCLVANGLYIGLGGWLNATDSSDLIGWGEPRWRLWAFGCACVPAGFALWNRQGADFGLGSQARRVESTVVAAVCVISAALMGLGLLIGR